MNKTLAITAIVLVAVVMVFGAVAPMMPQAEAAHGEKLPQEACDALQEKSKAPTVQPVDLVDLDHCNFTPPP